MKDKTNDLPFPSVIQGGMGVAVSNWSLARAVSMLGMLGTVSGVALERILVIILQNGDPGGHFRRALAHFPYQQAVERIMKEFYVEGGVSKRSPLRPCPMFTLQPSRILIDLTVCADFAAIWLAKEKHNGLVSINFLEKLQMPHPYALFGAMLAGVDVLTVGAGIPLPFPQMLEDIVAERPVRYKVDVVPDHSSQGPNYREIVFDPKEHFGEYPKGLIAPKFIPIISSLVLAKALLERLPASSIYGFVVEEDTAGGHNAPPRKVGGQIQFNHLGEPIYGPKDHVDYPKLAELCRKNGARFWIGGSMASPECQAFAKSVGAEGIQAGSIFALANESGLEVNIKRTVRRLGYLGQLKIFNSMWSPTGFPFKVVRLHGTVSDRGVYESRERICNQGALVTLYEKANGSIGYRCSAEPETDYVAKGGKLEDTVSMRCLCNGLLATAGLNHDGNKPEQPIVTLGNMMEGASFLKHLMRDENGQSSEFGSYSVADVRRYLLGS